MRSHPHHTDPLACPPSDWPHRLIKRQPRVDAGASSHPGLCYGPANMPNEGQSARRSSGYGLVLDLHPLQVADATPSSPTPAASPSTSDRSSSAHTSIMARARPRDVPQLRLSRRQAHLAAVASFATIQAHGQAPAAASKLPGFADSAWEALGGGPSDLTFPESWLGVWDVVSTLVKVSAMSVGAIARLWPVAVLGGGSSSGASYLLLR